MLSVSAKFYSVSLKGQTFQGFISATEIIKYAECVYLVSLKGIRFNLLVQFLLSTVFRDHKINPFTAVDAIWCLEVITHTAICSTFADKYFMHLNIQCAYFKIGTPIGLRLLG